MMVKDGSAVSGGPMEDSGVLCFYPVSMSPELSDSCNLLVTECYYSSSLSKYQKFYRTQSVTHNELMIFTVLFSRVL